jgi:hypothetical protein
VLSIVYATELESCVVGQSPCHRSAGDVHGCWQFWFPRVNVNRKQFAPWKISLPPASFSKGFGHSCGSGCAKLRVSDRSPRNRERFLGHGCCP